ncbi:MAG: MFS transporter [Lactobacillaceae bacterium]|jgi:oligogalacturonide transporter|nr:MFS transporter [Lactobacillaceae bacterium]
MENSKPKWVYTPKKITWLRSLGYAVNDMNGGAWGTLIGSYLMFFLTTYAKLTPASVGFMFLFAKLFDTAFAMILGTTSDNLFNTKIGRRFGRRHLYLLVGALTILIFFPMLFVVVPGSIVWYFVAYLMINTANMTIGIAYETLPAEMTPNAEDRVRMGSVRLFVSAFATFAVSALPALLLSILGDETAIAYTISGIVFGVVFTIGTLITYRSTWEFSPEYVEQFEAPNKIKDDVKISIWTRISRGANQYYKVWKNKSARRMVVIYFISYFAKDCYSTAFLYYVVFILGMNQALGQSVASISFVGMFVVPVAAWMLMKTKNPKVTWGTSFTIVTIVLVAYGVLYLTGVKLSGTSALVTLMMLGVGWQIGRQLLEYTAWQVIPLVPDVDTLASTQLRAGSFAAVQTFTRQTTGALGNAVIGVALSASGFVAGATHQSSSAKDAIMILFIAIPLACIWYAGYLVKGFNLNQNTHKIVKTEIDRLSAGGSKDDVDPETKRVAEDLTGYKWEDIWNIKN